jgi:hypothetical protein
MHARCVLLSAPIQSTALDAALCALANSRDTVLPKQ